MPRPRKLDRPRALEVQIPTSLRTRLDMELYSDVEGRVPHGAYTVLVVRLINDWLKARQFPENP